MKNWSLKFNPHRVAFRTPSLFRLRKIIKINQLKARQSFNKRRNG